jgi:MFS family permease
VALCAVTGIDALGYAIVIPLIPFTSRAMGLSALAIGGLFASYSLCQLVAAPALGSASDRFGRRPVLLLSQAGSAAGFLLLALARSPLLILLSRVVDGLSAGNISVAYAAVLDAGEPAVWARTFAYLSASTGAGVLVGLAASSALARFGLPAAALASLALSLGGMMVTALLLPETRQRRGGQTFWVAWRKILVEPNAAALRRTALAVLLACVAQGAVLLSFPLLAAQRLGYDATRAAVLMTVLVAMAAVFQLALVPRLSRVLGDRRGALVGFALLLVGGFAFAWARDLLGIAVAATVFVWGVVTVNPLLTALMGKNNRVVDEGALMGVNQAVVSAGQMLGPPLGYGALQLPGAAFGALCAGLAGAGLLITSRVKDGSD